MTDTADLEKRLRKRTVAVHGGAGVFTTVLRHEPDALCIEAADALSSLTKKLEEARAVLEPFAAALPQGYETRFDGPQGAARYAAITTVELRPRHFAQAVNFLSSADADVVTDQGEK